VKRYPLGIPYETDENRRIEVAAIEKMILVLSERTSNVKLEAGNRGNRVCEPWVPHRTSAESAERSVSTQFITD
jgi:hypothetical protein